MGLYDELKSQTKTSEQVSEEERKHKIEKRVSSLEMRVHDIMQSITIEAKNAAKNGHHNLRLQPYYVHPGYDFDSEELFYSAFSYQGGNSVQIRDNLYRLSMNGGLWKDLYELTAEDDGLGMYGFIRPSDTKYILDRVSEELQKEGFLSYSVSFQKEYEHPTWLIFKTPTGRNVLSVSIEW